LKINTLEKEDLSNGRYFFKNKLFLSIINTSVFEFKFKQIFYLNFLFNESNSRFYKTRSINKNQYIRRSLSTIIQLNHTNYSSNMPGLLKKEHVMELRYQHKILVELNYNFKKIVDPSIRYYFPLFLCVYVCVKNFPKRNNLGSVHLVRYLSAIYFKFDYKKVKITLHK
ncbi:hypothetical protein BpHYR1_036484, partial [Brachionus plicatilis]